MNIRFALCVMVAALAGGISAEGQTKLQLKTAAGTAAGTPARGKSRQTLRTHYLVELSAPVDAARLGRVGRLGRERGTVQQVVSLLPPYGFILAAVGEPNVSGLPVVSVRPIAAEQKISRAMGRGAEAQGMVIEFHHDVAWEERRALLKENGFTLLDHPDLTGEQLLVRGTRAQLEELAVWDEVAYAFPASAALLAGEPVVGCLGGAVENGVVSALAQAVGEGWDGPGQNKTALAYAFKALTARLGAAEQKAEIVKALNEWSKYVQVSFNETTTPDATRTIGILFGAGSHGDAYPFDGPGKVLAHAFYPSEPNPETIAGDLHLDDAEAWRVGADIDLFSVALHELGHALGLAHSDAPSAVMYPYYRRVSALNQNDIDAIQTMYAPRTSTDPAPTPTEPTTPTPSPTEPTTPSTPAAPYALTITTPSANLQTTYTTVQMSGMVTGVTGAPTVRWTSDRGSYGDAVVMPSATGSFTWVVPAARLVSGANTITVLATDSSGTTVGKSTVVNVQAAAGSGPALTLSTPSATTFTWPSPTVALAGNATSSSAIQSVTWRATSGASGTATGTNAWRIASVPLQRGLNSITLTVTDADGRTAALVVVVFRY